MRSTEQLRIDTPEQIALELPIAGIGSRFLALATDTVLQILVYVGVFILYVALPGFGSRWAILDQYFVASLVLFLFCVYWGYFALFELVWRGQTPGKRLARIRVISESGRPINVYQVIARNLVRVIDLLPGMYAVGVVCMMLNQYSKRLGDYVAGTVVVHDRQPEHVRADWRTAPGNGPAVSTTAARLTSEELVVIETYLQRRLDLTEEVRNRTALQIIDRITAKTGLRPEPGQHLDDFLENVARQVRDTARFR